MTDLELYLDEQQPRYMDELLDLLRIPSISALPANAADVRRAAEWTCRRLQAAGMEHAEVMETGGHPVVYADWLHAPGKPVALIYGHFDTQPADPLELWDHPPFEPHVDGDRIYARGASDDKGNMFAALLALEALLATQGALPVNVKVLFEGQEEIGSPMLAGFVAGRRDLLAADVVLSADSSQYAEDQPAVTVGLRGICALQLDVRGPAYDLHSGIYGGAVQNPLHALVRLLDSMRSPDGKVLVQGFYAGVEPLTAADRADIAAVPFEPGTYMADLGVTALYGEPGYTPRERAWARPTLEINGLWGGFQGDGTKTVIPSLAHAKITCRLVPGQDPARVVAAIRAHVARHAPAGVEVTVTQADSGARAYLTPADNRYLRAAVEVLSGMYGREPYLERTGGSVPVTTFFMDSLGAYTINFGFGLPDEHLHSPNEFFRRSSFHKGQIAYCRLLERLANEPPGA